MNNIHSSTTSLSQQHSFVYDDQSKQAIVKGMDELHVIIKIPFKRPKTFNIANPVIWTREKEEILWAYLTESPEGDNDWDEISKRLNMSTAQVIKHSSLLLTKGIKDIKNLHSVQKDENNQESSFSSYSSCQVPKVETKNASDESSFPIPSVHSMSDSSHNTEDLKQLSSVFNQLTLEKQAHERSSSQASKTSSEAAHLSNRAKKTETDESEEQESEGSGIGTPFSELSDGSIAEDSLNNEDYLSQLKNSAFSLFK